MGYWEDIDNLTPEEYARRFRYFTPGQLRWSMRSRGLDVVCTDEATTRAAADVHARVLVRADRETERAGRGS